MAAGSRAVEAKSIADRSTALPAMRSFWSVRMPSHHMHYEPLPANGMQSILSRLLLA